VASAEMALFVGSLSISRVPEEQPNQSTSSSQLLRVYDITL
jgi:hypothetical protein